MNGYKTKTIYSLTLFLALIFICPLKAKAEGSKPIWPDTVKVGGEFRTRVEGQFNYDLDSSTSATDDVFVLLRTRVYLDLNPGEGVKIFGMFQDSRTLGQNTMAVFKTPSKTTWYQGYAQFVTKGKLSTRIRAGRQELKYGTERLIGAFNWGNLGRSFDAFVIRVEDPTFWADFFGARIKLPNGKEAQLAAGYSHIKKFFGGIMEPYVIVYHGNTIGRNNGELSIVTMGTRIKGKKGVHWDYDFEGAYQVGKEDGNLHSAYALHGGFGYTFTPKRRPRLAFIFNFASGDKDPQTGTVTLFNNILPTNHGKYGYIDFFSWRNMYDLSVNFSIFPVKFMKAYLAYHAFFLPEPANGVFAASGKQFRAGAPGASSFAGQEFDVLFKFTPWKYFDSLVGYSIFFPGQFFADTGISNIAQFFYAQIRFHY